MKNILISIAIITLIFSCKKDEKYSDIPEIEFISLTPSSTIEFKDQINLVISYKDGNGDIGTIDPDVYSIEVKDSRLPAADKYHVKPLTPPGQSLQIEGELNIVLTGLFVLGSGTSETATFKVKLQDRAGNWSNEITTSAITIKK